MRTSLGSASIPAAMALAVCALPAHAKVTKIVVRPGDTLSVGYSLMLPGKHAAANVTLSQAQVVVEAECVGHRDHRHHHHHHGEHERDRGPIIVNIPDPATPFAVPQNGKGWLPAANPNDPASFQASITVPDLCQGGAIEIGDRATFTAMVGSQ